MNILVRAAIIDDWLGIRHVHRNCDDPWHNEDECQAWIAKRIERGFYIQVAECDGKIVGHGEWNVSDEPNVRMFYLNMLQVDTDYQCSGIGRAMIEDGMVHAKINNCSVMVTIPESDNNSYLFYEKCGFVKRRIIKKCDIPTKANSFRKYTRVSEVPFSIVSEMPYIFGLSQISSQFMWEICNRKPETDDRYTPAIVINDTTFVQLLYSHESDSSLVLCWSKLEKKENLIESILSFGDECGLKYLTFRFFEENEPFFRNYLVEDADIEMIRDLN